MASAATIVSGGGYATSTPGTTTQVSGGPAVANGAVPWNTSLPTRTKVPWIPKASTPFLAANGTVSREWYDFFHHIAETRMGGVNGPTVTQVYTDVQTTQSSVVSVIDNVNQVNAYARSIDETATASRTVAVNNGLSGAATIPEPTEPPPRATAGTQVA